MRFPDSRVSIIMIAIIVMAGIAGAVFISNMSSSVEARTAHIRAEAAAEAKAEANAKRPPEPVIPKDKLEATVLELRAELDKTIIPWQWRKENRNENGDLVGGEWLEGTKDTHWMTTRYHRYKMEVKIPDSYAGAKIDGGEAYLEIKMFGPQEFTAIVTVNGEEATTLPVVDPKTYEHKYPRFLLTEEAKPGDSYNVEVQVSNRLVYPVFDYPLHNHATAFYSAELVLEDAKDLREDLVEAYYNLYAADQLTKPWQPTADRRPFSPERINTSKLAAEDLDTLRKLAIDKLNSLNMDDLTTGNGENFFAAFNQTVDELQPLQDLANQFTIHLTGNAHIDLAWLWRTSESVAISANTYRSVLNNMEIHPNMVYAQSQAQSYEWVEKERPELFADIKKKIEEGSWDVVGGMWAEPDCNVPGGESWVRQILYAKNYFKEKFGVDVWLGWNPDSFGYNANMPQLFARAGLKAFITQKISWNDSTRFPYHLFWWESADGSRILTYFPTGSYVEKVEPDKMIDQMLNFEHASGFKDSLILIGFGNHGGGPNLPMLDRAAMLARLKLFPKVKFTKPHDYVQMMMDKDLSNIPVWKSELYLEGHRGTLTTQSNTKKNNRQLEALLETTEKAAALAATSGFQLPHDRLLESWKVLMLNQFHDILPGSSITPVFRDADESYAYAKRVTSRVLRSALASLGGEAAEDAVVVFNPLSWQRDDIVSLDIDEDDLKYYSIVDPQGNPVASQIVVSDDGLDRSIQFKATAVPALGTKYYRLVESQAAPAFEPQQNVRSIENEFLKVEVNPVNGNINSIYDKKNGREILSDEGNVLQIHENIPGFWDAWNIGYTENSWEVSDVKSITLVEDNEMRKVLRIKKTFLGLSKMNQAPTEGFPSSFFTTDLILEAGSNKLDVKLDVDWWEDKALLKVAFPMNVSTDLATYEIPYGFIERTTKRETAWEKARFEVSVHRWADLSEESYGVSLLNDSKYGMDIDGSTMRLTMLTAATWPDPLADRGRHSFRYAIYPHAGNWRSAATVKMANEFNLKTAAQRVEKVAPSTSLMQIDVDNVLITSIKRAENGEGLVIRLNETSGVATTAKLTLSGKAFTAAETDLMENIIGEQSESASEFSFEVPANAVVSYLLK